MMLPIDRFPHYFEKAFGCVFSGQDAETCFRLAQQQIEGVAPLTVSKIRALYKVLFRSHFVGESERHLGEGYHVAHIVQPLYLVTEPYKKNKKFETEMLAGQSGADGLKGVYKGKSSILVIFKEGERIGRREQIAYLLDKEHRAGVRPTVFLNLPRLGKGSGQLFEPNCKSLESVAGERANYRERLRQISIFYTRILNQDGHPGNILLSQDTGEVFSIDHGDSLPMFNEAGSLKVEMFEDVGQEPFTPSECQQIEELEDDSELLRKHQCDDDTVFHHGVALKLLKSAASRTEAGANLSPFDLNVIRHTTGTRAARPSQSACTPNAPTRIGQTLFQEICANRASVDDRMNSAFDEIIQIKARASNSAGGQDSTYREIARIYAMIAKNPWADRQILSRTSLEGRNPSLFNDHGKVQQSANVSF